jgi:hypothetical protein
MLTDEEKEEINERSKFIKEQDFE